MTLAYEGLIPGTKEYNKEAVRRYRLRFPERAARSRQQSAKRRRAEMAAVVVQWKLEHGCVDCGDRWISIAGVNPDALEFDHPYEDPKRHPNGKRVNWKTRSYIELFNELERTEVVCAICHNLRTARRKA